VGGDPPGEETPAARIQRLRTSLGLSQEQLARQLGVSFATVNRWESGRTQMSARAIRALSEFEARATAGSPQPAGLPAAQSSFIGREHELAELAALLGRSRLVTLIGPGGAGKTRLAIEAIRKGPAAPVAFIPLEPVRQAQSLPGAVASCLRVRDRPGVSAEESVIAALRAAGTGVGAERGRAPSGGGKNRARGREEQSAGAGRTERGGGKNRARGREEQSAGAGTAQYPG
jgi:transcriptional regulator with XRE-family HTH domain